MQQSLFPDEFEVQAATAAALRDLDVRNARRLHNETARRNPHLVNLTILDDALCLLEALIPDTPPGPADLARVWLAAREESRLGDAAADFVDETVARYHARRKFEGPFLDDAQRVHRAALDLCLNDAETAERTLAQSLDAGFVDRADLWALRGDAAVTRGRPREANDFYVRALVLAARDIDMPRLRHEPLRLIYEDLCRWKTQECARELLLVHAVLEGVLDVPTGNDRWHSIAAPPTEPDPSANRLPSQSEQYRRFAWLLFRDLSRPLGGADLAEREEMASLDPGLFGRYLDARRKRDG